MSRNPEFVKTLPIPGNNDDGLEQPKSPDSKEASFENRSYQGSSTAQPTQQQEHVMASQTLPPSMNPWEAQALTQLHPGPADPLFYSTLYCPSGWDLMSILMQVLGRPNPVIDLGAIDCSVALTLCDLEQPDTPIVYASDAFYELTGYTSREVLGRNCRFLQTSPHVKDGADETKTRRMSTAIRQNQELQIELWNWKKNGQGFRNVLSIIPVQIDGHRYAVGLQCEV